MMAPTRKATIMNTDDTISDISTPQKQQHLKRVAPNLWKASPSGIYYAIIKYKGKSYRKSLGADRQTADRKLKKYRSEIGYLSPDADRKMPFETLAGEWLKTRKIKVKESSYIRYEGIVKSLGTVFNGKTAPEITRNLITEWVSKRIAQNSSPRTLTYEQNVLKAILQHAVQDGILMKNPLAGEKPFKGKAKEFYTPSDAELQKLLETLRTLHQGEEAARLVEMLAYSGCRLNEATSMVWGDIGDVYFKVTGGEKGTKNHQERDVPLFPSFKAFLDRIKPPDAKESDTIIKIQSAKRAIISACKIAELTRMTHHSFRHYFTTRAMLTPIDGPTVAKWVGHKDGGTLLIRTYTHVKDQHSLDMAQRI